MAFVQLEDAESTAEVVLFPKTFAKAEQWLNSSNHVFVVKGPIDLTSPTQLKIKANECVPIEQVLQEWPRITQATLQLPPEVTPALLEELRTKLAKGTIPLDLTFSENGKQLRLTTKSRIALDPEMVKWLESLQVGVTIAL